MLLLYSVGALVAEIFHILVYELICGPLVAGKRRKQSLIIFGTFSIGYANFKMLLLYSVGALVAEIFHILILNRKWPSGGRKKTKTEFDFIWNIFHWL